MRWFVFLVVICVFIGQGHSSPPNRIADRILIMKSDHTMKLFNNGQLIKTYKVALGDPKGPKVQAGDKKTPEGTYFVDAKNPHSLFHCTSLIRMQRTVNERVNSASIREATSKSTASPRNTPGWAPRIAASTGRPDASPSPILRSMRSGTPLQSEPPSKFGLRSRHSSDPDSGASSSVSCQRAPHAAQAQLSPPSGNGTDSNMSDVSAAPRSDPSNEISIDPQ
jgi:hypothetical protein